MSSLKFVFFILIFLFTLKFLLEFAFTIYQHFTGFSLNLLGKILFHRLLELFPLFYFFQNTSLSVSFYWEVKSLLKCKVSLYWYKSLGDL